MAHRALLTAFACLTLTATLLPVPAFAQSAPGWSLPWKLNADAGSVDELVMAALPSGGTLAVWSATVAGPSSVLFYSEFVPASGWQAPAAIDSGGSYSHLALRLNSGGSGALVWSLYAGVQVTYGSFFQPGTGFSRAAALSNNSFVDSAPPTVAVDGAGLVTVLWPEQDGANLSEFAARGDASARTWGLAELVEHDNVGRAYGELGALAVDGNGTVHALWKHFNGTIGRVFTNTYTSGTGWGTETGLDNGSSTWHFNLHIAAFADGRAVALWTQEEWFTGALPLVTTFDPGRGWDAAPRLLLPQNATATDLVSFACGGPGTCIAAWSQNLGTHFGVVATSSVDRGDSFTTPHELDTSLLGNGHYSDAAVGPDGAGLLVWSQDSDPPAGADLLHAYASAFAPATGFGPTHRLDRVGTQSVDQVRASAGSQGFLAAAWMQKDATLDSGYASLFSAPDTTAPKLRVTAPLDGAVLTEPSVVVTGVTDPGSSVSVNGELALVRSNGSFALRIPLTVGQNQVRVTATDEAGNSAAVADPETVLDST